MSKRPELLIGCVAHGISHSTASAPDLATRFCMVRDAGVFDYIDRAPPDEEFRETWAAAEASGVPVLAGSGTYTLGQDEAHYERHVVKARLLGAVVHNVQLRAAHADGHALSDAEVAEAYERAYTFGARHGVRPSFEVHVNMWSEHVGRVARVAALVAQRGLPWHLTLDVSHVIFKIDNPLEQAVQGLKADVDAGLVVLEPDRPGSVVQAWIDAGWVHHAHARAAVPANPINHLARHPDGRYGRGIQYPLVRPGPGEYVSDAWDAERLQPWKFAMRQLLAHHASGQGQQTLRISCEYIPGIDYGAGHGYSLFENNVACAAWLRDQWVQLLPHAAPTPGLHPASTGQP